VAYVPDMPRAPFDHVTDEYERGRAGYPDGVFETIEALAGPLAGQLVIDGGAGTGISTRQLAARGPRLVAFDVSRPMLTRARRPDAPPFVVCTGNALPFRSGVADVVCFAQAWHWLDPELASAEVARVLRPGGTWAAWWSHPRADGERWFDTYLALVEQAIDGFDWSWRDHPWGDTLAARHRFDEPVRRVIPWMRTMTADEWLTETRSHSMVAAMPYADREALIGAMGEMLRATFGDEPFPVPHDTRVWTARRGERD
jgi:SAM-dependent methyltransferase